MSYIRINKQSEIAKKVKLFKELYNVAEVEVLLTGTVIINGQDAEFVYEIPLAEDLKCVSYYGYEKPFKLTSITGANILIKEK